jgi:hypothetical protein
MCYVAMETCIVFLCLSVGGTCRIKFFIDLIELLRLFIVFALMTLKKRVKKYCWEMSVS